jgi:hypothetical protein
MLELLEGVDFAFAWRGERVDMRLTMMRCGCWMFSCDAGVADLILSMSGKSKAKKRELGSF